VSKSCRFLAACEYKISQVCCLPRALTVLAVVNKVSTDQRPRRLLSLCVDVPRDVAALLGTQRGASHEHVEHVGTLCCFPCSQRLGTQCEQCSANNIFYLQELHCLEEKFLVYERYKNSGRLAVGTIGGVRRLSTTVRHRAYLASCRRRVFVTHVRRNGPTRVNIYLEILLLLNSSCI